jgi:large subunit ribosomal protein L17
MRFHMTAATIARDQKLGRTSNKLTLMNRKKVLRYRENGPAEFQDMIKQMKTMGFGATEEEREARKLAREEELEDEDEDEVTDIAVDAAVAAERGTKKSVTVLR